MRMIMNLSKSSRHRRPQIRPTPSVEDLDPIWWRIWWRICREFCREFAENSAENFGKFVPKVAKNIEIFDKIVRTERRDTIWGNEIRQKIRQKIRQRIRR